ncbi:deoxyguanosinetriphosphate triphosphohydrolase family protein [Lacisediminihabitans sp. H27-G8]|uniref:deoxyguanosinetriphosphate triphosphohydrolase family protein n=1 Tax=Lacisediminihabitans sp. H27-G8 TaxID=3111909 RepID=UPI0038FC0A53
MADDPGYVFVAGPSGLHILPNGSLVSPEKYVARYSRGGEVPKKRADDLRSETERDRGRLGYSPFLRRLAGVTQVISPDLSSSRMHSRASHSHKVALVARELSELIARKALIETQISDVIAAYGGLDIAACEAAGLAHDLGHPPFGHAGEQELDRQLVAAGVTEGFEGNAQTFRIVSRLDARRLDREGLDLTNVTLAAILKYSFFRSGHVPPELVQPSADADHAAGSAPGDIKTEADNSATEHTSKFGAYAADKDAFIRSRAAILGTDFAVSEQQTIEASIMDLADDIAYAIHDLEDFLSAGVINFANVGDGIEKAFKSGFDHGKLSEKAALSDPFIREAIKLRDRYEGYFDDEKFKVALGAVFLFTQTAISTDDSDGLASSALKEELSDRVSRYFASVKIDADGAYPGGPLVYLSPEMWHDIQVLKMITRQYLVSTPRMGMIQRSQTQAIRVLFKGLADWLVSTPDQNSLPASLQDALIRVGHPELPKKKKHLTADHYRAICDYICGMSDAQALTHSLWISGREVPGMSVVVEAG